MLSYRHGFHAGNKADVFKHAVLFSFLKLYTQNEKPFTAFDLNAGSAYYNLFSEWSLKTGEAQDGILKLLDLYEKNKLPLPVPDDFKSFLEFCLKNYKTNFNYAGSPEIIRTFLQKNSNLILCDLHPAEAENLKLLYKKEKNIFVHKRNCYEAVKALAPPNPVRGFALFDPSYEIESDYTDIAESIEKTIKKWQAGIFIIWYPLLNRRTAETAKLKHKLKDELKQYNKELINIEIKHNLNKNCDDDDYGLQGSGILIINPPWRLEEKLNEISGYIEHAFTYNTADI